MLLSILSISVALLAIQICSSVLSAWRKYGEARKIGLPVVFIPINQSNILWRLILPTLIPLIKNLPFGLGKWTQFTEASWLYRSSFDEELDPAFVLVNPSNIQLVISDPEAVEEVFNRRKEFIKADLFFRLFDMFGSSVATTNGEDWQRHRRITTPTFNERNNNLVWRESLFQAKGMVKSWKKKQSDGAVISTWHDSMTLALNVLMGAGFGKRISFDDGEQERDSSSNKAFLESLRLTLENLIISSLTISKSIPLRFLPPKIARVKKATLDFRRHMEELVKDERNSIREKGTGGDNLMSVLIRSLETAKSNGWNSLTDSEIFGNLFVYNVAGHDSTAKALMNAILLLAADQKTQEWLREEIVAVIGGHREDVEKWQYENAFPRLKRCLALMHEILRLYPALAYVPRRSISTPVKLKIAGKEHLIPPHTSIIANITKLQILPQYWGPEPLAFRPQRWIISPGPTSQTSSPFEAEEHIQPKPGTFIPWISGPRFCPGKRFSQVEFVAAVAYLLGKYKVVPILLEGETEEMAGRRIRMAVEDEEMQIALLKMKKPESVMVRWVEI